MIALSSVAAGIYRDGFAAFFPFLQKEFGLTRAQLGLHSSFFFLASTIAAIHSGRLVDLKGAKWGMAIGVSFMGMFMILHASAPSYLLILIFASFTGLAMSTIAPGASKAITKYFSPKTRNSAMGINWTGYSFGGVLAAALLPFLATRLGWRGAILIPGFLALIISYIILRFFQEKKREEGETKGETQEKRMSFWNTCRAIINLPFVFLLILGFFLASVSAITAAHFTLFLYLDYGYSEILSGLGFTFMMIGSLTGKMSCGYFCDGFLKGNKKKSFLVLGILFFFGTLSLGLLFRSMDLPFYLLAIMAFFIGFAGRGWHGLYFTSIAEAGGEEHSGFTTGLSMLFARGGAVLSPPLFGYLADATGSYSSSWILLGLLMLLVMMGQYFLKN